MTHGNGSCSAFKKYSPSLNLSVLSLMETGCFDTQQNKSLQMMFSFSYIKKTNEYKKVLTAADGLLKVEVRSLVWLKLGPVRNLYLEAQSVIKHTCGDKGTCTENTHSQGWLKNKHIYGD